MSVWFLVGNRVPLRVPLRVTRIGLLYWLYYRGLGFLAVCLVLSIRNGGMGYGDYYLGIYRDYYRDPFPPSLLSTRELRLWAFRALKA